MKTVFLVVGTEKEAWLKGVRDSYAQKIGHFVPFEIVTLKSKSGDRDDRRRKMDAESQAIMGSLKDDDFLVLFDEKGQALNSIEFSKKTVRFLESGKKRLVFVIGGAYGFSETLQERANARLSLSNLTMNHHVAQFVALEQIYRALTIWRGIPYHNP